MDIRDPLLPTVNRWRGKWISLPLPDDSGQRYRAYRSTFVLDSATEDYVAHITAENEYALFLNGRLVGRGPTPAPPAFRRYDSYWTKSFMQSGKNTVAVLVSTRNVNDSGYNLSGPANGAMLFQLEAAGRVIHGTDESWQAAEHTGFISDHVYMGSTYMAEFFQAGVFPANWHKPEFDSSRWNQAAAVVPARHSLWGSEQPGGKFFPWVCLEPSEVKRPLERTIRPEKIQCGEVRQRADFTPEDAAVRISLEPLQPNRHTRIENAGCLCDGSGITTVVNSNLQERAEHFTGIFNAVIILDFGRPVNGRLSFSMTSDDSFSLDLGYALNKEPDGHLVPYVANYIKQADVYIGTPGRQTHETFGWRHFRYVQLTFRSLAVPLTIETLQVAELAADFDEKGQFSASDPLLEQIWRGAIQTLQLCCTDQVMDNPQRERRQYLGDCAAAIPSLLAVFGDNAVARKYFRQFAQTQHETGLYRYSTWHQNDAASLFDHSLIYPIRLLDYYRFTGNIELIREVWPGLRRLETLILSVLDADGLAHEVPYSLWFDWADVGRKDCSFLLNAYILRALECSTRLAEAAGKTAEDTAIDHATAKLREQLRTRFWVPESGLFADTRLPDGTLEHFSEHSNLLALGFGIADGEQIAALRKALTNPDTRLESSSPCWQFAAEGFLAGEMTGPLLTWLHRHFEPLFRNGITTVPETWVPGYENTPGYWRHRNGRALAQGSGVIIHPWVFLEKLCGISPLRAGFEAVRFMPQPGPLEHISGSMPAPDGLHRMEAVRKEKVWKLRFELPRRKEAEFVQTMAGRCRINGVSRPPDSHWFRRDGTRFNRFILQGNTVFEIAIIPDQNDLPAQPGSGLSFIPATQEKQP